MKLWWHFLVLLGCFFWSVRVVSADQTAVLGIHILSPNEVIQANEFLRADHNQERWYYVTVPFTLHDLTKKEDWQRFMSVAKEKRLIPIVRLATRFDQGAWQVPTKQQIVQMMSFLGSLDWPGDSRIIVAFNEVNHAKEWGNTLSPAEYASVLRFTSDWAKTEPVHYIVLPAAMDLAAPNSKETMEAFRFLEQMWQADPTIFDTIDAWNSHSYPNPGFSSPANKQGQQSISGFRTELAFIKQKTGRSLQTYITETGWVENALTSRKLDGYYQYAATHVWSSPDVIAVTPFLLQGQPGPFASFSFLNQYGQPTRQYFAFQHAMKTLVAR